MDDNMELHFEDIMDYHSVEHSPHRTEEEKEGRSMFQFDEERLPARIKVVGVGGGGCNAVSTMVQAQITGVEFIVTNTDMQSLDRSQSPVKLQIGTKLTNGRGAGSNPEIGRNAAMEDAEKIKNALTGAEMVFVTAGMGGGTGTGGAPVIAQIARELKALTVAVVTKPFEFEGELRKRKAEEGIAELKKHVDAIIVIPNERLLNLAEKRTSLIEGFRLADSVLVQAVKGIADVVMNSGHVNVDFADIKTVMANKGRAVMGTGTATGEGRALEAAQKAIASPLLEDGSIKGARAVLINITGGKDMGMYEFQDAVSVIKNEVDPGANIKVGTVITDDMSEEIQVTVIATGFDEEGIRDRAKKAPVSLKEFIKGAPNLKKKQEAFDFKNEALGLLDLDEPSFRRDLDKPTFLRRQAD